MRYLIVFSLVFFAPLCWSEVGIADNNCNDQYAAKLVSLQGTLYFDPDSKGQWQPAQLNETICEGSRVRVETHSRASLLLTNGIVLRLDAGTVLSLNGLAPDKPTLLDLFKGFVHFISRTPKRLEITTPIANAGPEGTEFAMSVDDNKASLWVYEGGVRFFNKQGSIQLKPGQGAQAKKGLAPQAKIDIKPQDAVNWALYYPPLLPYPDATTIIDSNIRTAIQDFRRGHVDIALSRLDGLSPEKQTPYFFKIRGAIRLTAGQDKLASQDIRALLANNPNDAEALALQSVLALTQNRKEEAYTLANRAISADPHSATAYSALSYAEQGRFELEKAQAAADQATKLAPHDAMVWARKAELELAQGLTSESKETARRALGLDAALERTQTVTGFAYLLRMDTDEALETFEKAVKLDSTSPLARLGLGLAKIRNGDLEEGRQDLEIAAILDPGNSLVRSYLGKAYYEERRSTLAEDQFSLAKERDPKDPTPYFYDAISKQTTNRPVEALHDMQKAIELNDNRAVYRSKLSLDKDAAARTANVARIYNDLGFGRVALKEAWKSLGYDSTNPSAHRFLSDAYIGQPRYRVARASELLQAQLLQPTNITPVQPQLTSENIGILNSTGPGTLSVNEYDPLYNANGAHVVLNGAYGSRNTKTDNAIISGVYNNFSGSLGQFHYQTDGFRENDDYQQNIYNVFAQYAFSPDFTIQGELKSENVEAGDVPLRLNGYHQEDNKVEFFDIRGYRENIKQDTARIGSHYRVNAEQDVIASFFYTTREDSINRPNFYTSTRSGRKRLDTVSTDTENSGHQSEIQYLYHPGDKFDITAGFGYLSFKNSVKSFIINDNFINPPFANAFIDSSQTESRTNHFNGYIYSKQYLLKGLTTIIGLSFDSLTNDLISFDSFSNVEDSQPPSIPKLIDRQQLNPKFGIIWNPIKNLTLRGAAFRTLKRQLAANQTIEPTQVAGFNQFFDDNNGTTAWRYAFGLDYNLIKTVFLGGEISWRDTKQPFLTNGDLIQQKRNESSHLAYLYWTPTDWMSLRTEYRFDKISRDYIADEGSQDFPRSVATHQVPIAINLFHSNGLFAKISGTYVNQTVALVVHRDEPGFPLRYQSENFWTFDTAVGYRFPKKIGTISFEVRNLFDNKFNYQSNYDASGPQISPFVPERQLFVKLNLFY